MDLIRVCEFSPYRKGCGPKFRLRLWDTGRSDELGKQVLAYALHYTGDKNPIFAGEDFHCSPMVAIDSDSCVASLMAFLTLRPGDTDAEYFAHYTDRQREFCDQHAESLAGEVYARFERD